MPHDMAAGIEQLMVSVCSLGKQCIDEDTAQLHTAEPAMCCCLLSVATDVQVSGVDQHPDSDHVFHSSGSTCPPHHCFFESSRIT